MRIEPTNAEGARGARVVHDPTARALPTKISLSSGVPFQILGRYTASMVDSFSEHVVRRGLSSGVWLVLRRCLQLSAVAFVALAPGACVEPLLTPDEPRSQYDRTDAVRDRRAPSYVMDEFGSRRPNLRGRLVKGE